MCLLVLIHRIVPGLPVVVAANRDELYARESAPPRRWQGVPPGGVSFLAPVDLRANGTWIGINGRGAVAAITNRKSVPFNKDAPSRGLLCAGALSCNSAAEMIADCLQRADGRRHNGFNLLVADRDEAWILEGDGSRVRRARLRPGVHVLTNEHDVGTIALSAGRWIVAPDAPRETIAARLIGLLKSHEPISADGFSPCKHLEDRGTRSAAVIAAGNGGVLFYFAGGPPCNTTFEDLSASARVLMCTSS